MTAESQRLTKQLSRNGKSLPHIVYGSPGADVSIDSEAAAVTMRELGISDEVINSSTVYIDPKNRLINNGTHYSKRLARLRFRYNPELAEAESNVIRISTRVKGRDRSEELMNRTFIHEAEHLAQTERHCRKVKIGNMFIYGSLAVGALLGSQLGKGKVWGVAWAALGALLGCELGYRLAPHERQARRRAGQMRGKTPEVVSKAVERTQ